MIKSDIVIIGGGLTGMTLAYLLNKEEIPFTIIESRERLGGRIHTVTNQKSPPTEMGATWLGTNHKDLMSLLEELNIDVFPQVMGKTAIYEAFSLTPHQLVQLPPNQPSSYRIKGSTSHLINTLSNQLRLDQLLLNEEVKSIQQNENRVCIQTNSETILSKLVISTLPPLLLKRTITVTPALPDKLQDIMENTHRWMSESIKISLSFEHPFWKDNNSTGTIFSNVGPIPEMYDHSNNESNLYALKGFLNFSYHSVSKEERLQAVLKQLRKYYGDLVDNYTAYHEMVWSKEKYTYTPYSDPILPHQNNGHPAYQEPYLNGRLIIAGSETSTEFSGYMEGAIKSAHNTHKLVKIQLKNIN